MSENRDTMTEEEARAQSKEIRKTIKILKAVMIQAIQLKEPTQQHSDKADEKTTCCNRPLISALNERTGQVGWYCKGCGGYVSTVVQCHVSTPIPLPSVTSSADDPVNSCRDKIHE